MGIFKENYRYTWLKLFTVPLIGIFLFFLFNACNKEPEKITYLQESDHFILHANSLVTSQEEIALILEKCESLFPHIYDFLGEMHKPNSKIHIRLKGDMISRGSYVDVDGINLYRYNQNDGGYLAVIAHELTHAFIAPWFIKMQAWDWTTYRFFDEGFAEYVAQKVDPLKVGFPFYGYPEDIVAGNLVVTNSHIPFDDLRTKHFYYNEECNLQAYPQRTSWIRHLDEVYGREALFSIVFHEKEPTNEIVDSLIGVGLSELDNSWKTWIVQKYNNIEDTQEIIDDYHNRTSWYTTCE